MSRGAICSACIVLAVGLVASIASAGECKPINVRAGAAVYLDPCEYQGDSFEFCIDTPINGTINGTWHYYGPADNAVFVDFPPGVGDYPGLAAGWALDVLSANDGEIWAQNAYVFHYDTWSLAQDFVYSSTSYITGGTGKYAGATGWFGFVGSELKGGIIHGEICTP